MTVEIIEYQTNCQDWRVEAIDDDGGCEVAIFCGPRAEERARRFSSLAVASAAACAMLRSSVEDDPCRRPSGAGPEPQSWSFGVARHRVIIDRRSDSVTKNFRPMRTGVN